jgi:copper chaperone CopZ
MFKEEPSIAQWDVDLNDPDRTLTVEGDNLNESRIIELIKKAGYEAVRI